MVVYNNILAGASGAAGAAAGYQVERSLRFNSDDSAHLYRQITSKGNTKTFTFACWLKKTRTGHIAHNIFSGSTGTDTGAYFCIPDNSGNALGTADSLVFKSDNGAGGGSVETDAIFRDLSAWYHVVLAVDTTLSTASDRVKIWVNGVSQTLSQSASPGYPNQNQELSINDVGHAAIGAEANGSSSSVRFYGSFYLADVHFIDGTAFAASDFGEYDDNNVWQSKEFTGTYPDTLSTEMTSESSGNIFPANGTSTLNALDGSTSTALDCRRGTHASTTSIRFTPSTAITGVTKIRVWAPFANKYQINGGGYQTFTGTSGWSEIYNSSSISLTTLDVIRDSGNDGSDYGHQLHAIEINDVILTRDGSNNSFHLDFSDNSSTTTIAEDSSGNDNDWTANNISVASGSGNDSLFDAPTNGTQSDTGDGGEVSGNYCTMNPLALSDSSSNASVSLANGNLEVRNARTNYWGTALSTFSLSSGKWYFEASCIGGISWSVGIYGVDPIDSRFYTDDEAIGYSATGYEYKHNGDKQNNSSTSSYGASYADGDVIGVALDLDGGTLTFYKNGTSQGTAFSSLSGRFALAVSCSGANSGWNLNFGQRAFAYQNAGTNRPADTFKAVCTANLPDPTIADGSDHFAISLWTVPSGSADTTISGLNFAPDWLLTKNRSESYNGSVYDTVRGDDKYLQLFSSSATAAETTAATRVNLTSDGFVLEADNDNSNYTAGSASVGWAWNAGTSTASNTDGSITSNVRANTSAGFSILTYTGTGASASVGHGLNSAPGFIIIKRRDGTPDWVNYHSALGVNKYIQLSRTDAATTSSGYWGTVNSSTFGLPSFSTPNANGGTYVAYCFAPVEGYSAFGSYTGNGDADGPFVYTGFRPKFLLWKPDAASTDWVVIDSERNTYNVIDDYLLPNSSAAEGTLTLIDFCSNGFKLRTTSAGNNTSGVDVVWAAFAEHPFKTARAR